MQRLVGQIDVTIVVARQQASSRRKHGSPDCKRAEADAAEHAFMMAAAHEARAAAVGEPDPAIRIALARIVANNPSTSVTHPSSAPSITASSINQLDEGLHGIRAEPGRYDLIAGDSVSLLIAEPDRAPQGPRGGDLVRAVVVVEGGCRGWDGDYCIIGLGRGDEIQAHRADLRRIDADLQHAFVDTSLYTDADFPQVPEVPQGSPRGSPGLPRNC